VGFDQTMQWHDGKDSRPHLIRQRGDAEIDAFAPEALALAVRG
jgi:hypothetical protein